MRNDDRIFCLMYTIRVGFCFTVNVYFLFRAKMKGFPAWPAKVSVRTTVAGALQPSSPLTLRARVAARQWYAVRVLLY